MMSVNVTWGTYFSVVAVALLIYYFFIAIIYYRQEIYHLVKGGKILSQKLQVPGHSTVRPEYDGLEPVVADIKGILEKAGTGAEKNALLPLLIQRLASYGGLKHPAFRIAVINYVIRNAESICGVALTERELEDALHELAG